MSPNNALQRTRAALPLQSVPGELSTFRRRRAPLSLGPFGDRSYFLARATVPIAGVLFFASASLAVATSARNAPPELAGLKTVWVSVSADNISGLDSKELAGLVKENLRRGGIQTEQKPGSRTLFVRITYKESKECPGSMYLRVSVALSERVRLARNPKLANVDATTWEETDLFMVRREAAAADASARALALVDYLTNTVAYATSVYAKPTGRHR